jgi:anti-anti-sigma factor
MAESPLIQLRAQPVEGVTVVELIPRELTEPEQATRMGEALREVLASMATKSLLIETSATKYMSSTSFAVLMSFGRKAGESGVKVAISGMDPFVKVGADIIKLGRVIPIYDDERTALAALIV